MRRLKLQAHISIDGFIAGPHGEMELAPNNWDAEVRRYAIDNLAGVDCVLLALARNVEMSFIPYWAGVAENPADPDHEFGKRVSGIAKIVFSRRSDQPAWPNAKTINADIVETVTQLKQGPGNDIMVYGGARFAATLIRAGLVDEYHLLVNPVAMGSGLPIFNELENKQIMTLTAAKPFGCGVILLHYQPRSQT